MKWAAGVNPSAAPTVKPQGSGETTSRVSTEANEIFTASASQRAARENNASVRGCGSVSAISDWLYNSIKDNLESIIEITVIPICN